MSKKDLDQFLGKKSKSPLDTDKIYGGSANLLDTVTVIVSRVKTKVKD
jgi:hypothetical protein